MEMPRINLMALWRKLASEDMALVRRIVDQKTWQLRGSRPKLRDSVDSRYAAFVWRMVAFYISPNAKHHCMPTTCYWWLPDNADKAVMQRLNRLINEITDTVPADEWWGCLAWRGLSEEEVELQTFCLKGWKNDVIAYFADSARRKEVIEDEEDVVDEEFLAMFQE